MGSDRLSATCSTGTPPMTAASCACCCNRASRGAWLVPDRGSAAAAGPAPLLDSASLFCGVAPAVVQWRLKVTAHHKRFMDLQLQAVQPETQSGSCHTHNIACHSQPWWCLYAVISWPLSKQRHVVRGPTCAKHLHHLHEYIFQHKLAHCLEPGMSWGLPC